MLRESPSLARLVYPVCGAVGVTTADVVETLLVVDVVPFPDEIGVVIVDELIVTTCPLVDVF